MMALTYEVVNPFCLTYYHNFDPGPFYLVEIIDRYSGYFEQIDKHRTLGNNGIRYMSNRRTKYNFSEMTSSR